MKYEVRTVMVETRDGKNALRVFGNKVDQDTTLVAAFDRLEDAQAVYQKEYSGVKCCGNRLYEHTCKLIEVNEYDDDGEWISGGDWLVTDFPDYTEVTADEC